MQKFTGLIIILVCLFSLDVYASTDVRAAAAAAKAKRLGASVPTSVATTSGPQLVATMKAEVAEVTGAASRAAEAASTEEDVGVAKDLHAVAHAQVGRATDADSIAALEKARRDLEEADRRVKERKAEERRVAAAAAAEAAEREAAAEAVRRRDSLDRRTTAAAAAAAAAAAEAAERERIAAEDAANEAIAAGRAPEAKKRVSTFNFISKRKAQGPVPAGQRAQASLAARAAAIAALDNAIAALGGLPRNVTTIDAALGVARPARQRVIDLQPARNPVADLTAAIGRADAAIRIAEQLRADVLAVPPPPPSRALSNEQIIADMRARFTAQQARVLPGCRGGICAPRVGAVRAAQDVNPTTYVKLDGRDGALYDNRNTIFKPSMARFIQRNTLGSNLAGAQAEAGATFDDENMLKNIQAAVRDFDARDPYAGVIVPRSLLNPDFRPAMNGAAGYGEVRPAGGVDAV